MDQVESAPGRHFPDLIDHAVNVQLAGHRAECVAWGYIEPQPWRNFPHVHSYFEVCYAFTGSGTFRCAGEEHVVRAGDLFVARPGELHDIVSHDADPLGLYFWGHTLVPSVSEPSGGDEASDTEELLRALAAGDGSVVATPDAALSPMLELLAVEAARPRAGTETVVHAATRGLLTLTARALVGTSTAAPPAPRAVSREVSLVRTLERYLRDNAHRSVRLRDVAAQAHLSERHTSRIFHRVTGRSVSSYLRDVRMEIACQRLLEDGVPVSEVARHCGYPDVRHFSTAFRRHTGQSPGEFRRSGGTRMAVADR